MICMSSLSKAIVKQVTARVFGCPTAKKVGGNPVTVFVWEDQNVVTKDDNRFETLAQTCSWESVHVVATKHNHHHPHQHIFYFYMPSGERVYFCAHAAMGASAVMVNNQNEQENHHKTTTTNHFNFITEHPSITVHTTKVDTQPLRVKLEMDCTNFNEQVLNTTTQIDTLKQLVSQIGLDFHQDVVHQSQYLPSCRNSTVARYKTLIPIVSLEKLHTAKNPKNSDLFRNLCDSIDSTGLYLYCPIINSSCSSKSYECRQFPRASGYPEDPATGIAASALACSLRKMNQSSSNHDFDSYQFYQGTAMGRRSVIEIKFENGIQETIKLLCSGNVDIDSTKILDNGITK